MKIESGNCFTLLLTDRGEVYSWGYNDNGRLGICTIDNDYHKPTKIDFILDIPIRYISVGYNHAAAIDFDYNVYIWGRNNDGRLGLGDKVDRSSPTIIENLTDKKVEKIYCGWGNTIALTQNGEVYSWGINNFGTSEPKNDNNINVLTKLIFPNNVFIKKLYVGDYHAYAVDINSKIYYWGNNVSNQLCIDDNDLIYTPRIANILDGLSVQKIICINNSTIILSDNKLYSIGLGMSGELGLGIVKAKEITMIKEGVETVWGYAHTVFCKMCNGDIYAWGLNNYGQLGIGNKTDQNTPVKLNIMLDIKRINFCNNVTYAISTSGEIYKWGLNKLVDDEPLLTPTLFTYFIDNDIEIKTMNRIKSARKLVNK